MGLRKKLNSLIGREEEQKRDYEIPESWRKKTSPENSVEKVTSVTQKVSKSASRIPKLPFKLPSWNSLPKHIISSRIPYLLTLERVYAAILFLLDGLLTMGVLATGTGGPLGLLTFFNTLLALSYLYKTKRKKEL